MNQRRVLAITKRRAQLCGAQSLLHASGLELHGTSSMKTARRAMQGDAVKGVIVCLHSWSERERDEMVKEIQASHPELSVIVRCPGCSGCDETNCTPGTLSDTQSFAGLKPANL